MIGQNNQTNYMKHCSKNRKFPLSRSVRSIFFALFLSPSLARLLASSLNIVVAECLKMLTGMNMFNAPSFCSVLFTRSVINSTEIWAFSPIRRVKRGRKGGIWVSERTKWKMSGQASQRVTKRQNRDRNILTHTVRTSVFYVSTLNFERLFDNWIEQLE